MIKNIIITIKGIAFDVKFEFYPEEKEVRYYSDCSGYPGSPAQITGILEIKHNNTDFYSFFEDNFKIVEDEIWDSIKQIK